MGKQKLLIALWGVLECLALSGVYFGWGSLIFVFKEEGIYYHLCSIVNMTKSDVSRLSNQSAIHEGLSTVMSIPERTLPGGGTGIIRTCAEQEEKFALAFIIASVIYNVVMAVIGYICLAFGLRVARTIMLCAYLTGTLCLAFVSKDNPWLIFPGTIGLASGGIPILQTNSEIAYMFEKGGSLVIGALSGATDSSVLTPFVIKIAHQNGIKRQYSFLFLSGLCILMLSLSTYCFLPKDHVKKKEDYSCKIEKAMELKEDVFNNDEQIGEDGTTNYNNGNVVGNSKSETDPADEINKKEQKEELNIPPLKQCFFSQKFMLHLFWFVMLQFRYLYFMESLNRWITELNNADSDRVSYYLDVAFYTFMAGFVFALIVNAVYDVLILKYKDKKIHYCRKLMPAILPLSMGSALCTLMSVLVLIPVLEVVYVTFVLLAAFRAILFSVTASYISFVFPGKYFTFLIGSFSLTAAIVNPLMFAVFQWTEAYPDANTHVNILMLVLSVASFAHPVWQWLTCFRMERKEEKGE